jgi:hypothetical protein
MQLKLKSASFIRSFHSTCSLKRINEQHSEIYIVKINPGWVFHRETESKGHINNPEELPQGPNHNQNQSLLSFILITSLPLKQPLSQLHTTP